MESFRPTDHLSLSMEFNKYTLNMKLILVMFYFSIENSTWNEMKCQYFLSVYVFFFFKIGNFQENLFNLLLLQYT